METSLLIGPASNDLGLAIAARANLLPISASLRVFPDGECRTSCRLAASAQRLVIVQGTHGPQDMHLQQLYQMVDIAAARGTREIICVVPYLAYSRQDRRFTDEEPHSALIVAKILAVLGAQSLVTVDAHNPDAYRDGPLNFSNLSAADLLAAHARAQTGNFVAVSPDKGGENRARIVARRLGFPVVSYDKHKTDDGTTSYPNGLDALGGRNAIVFDDLCSSGSTLLPLTRRLFADGARKVAICITHMLADPRRLQEQLGPDCHLLFTDSVPAAASRISLAALIASHLWPRFGLGSPPALSGLATSG